MIYTIGHSNHELGEFLGMLQAHAISVLIDVRSKPYSRMNAQYGKRELPKALRAAGIQYQFEGRALGGLDAISVADPTFMERMNRVLSLQSYGPVAMMCAEKNPAHCHRASKLTAFLHHHYPSEEAATAHILPDEILDARKFESQQKPGWVWHELEATEQLPLNL